MSFRLFAEKNTVAALNFDASTAGVFDHDSVEAGSVVAAHTRVAWHLVNRAREVRSALPSRGVIGQAKGILMNASGRATISSRCGLTANAPVGDHQPSRAL